MGLAWRDQGARRPSAPNSKLESAIEVTLKRWLAANFKNHGVQADHIKKIVVLPAGNTRKTITIILLKNPADEAQALAVSDEGAQGPKK